ncbi:MAG: hypothetical protein U5L09_13870 [Bacteroidales bacterium]|nr:hypothetical protein [Bacteroidales bacterium]
MEQVFDNPSFQCCSFSYPDTEVQVKTEKRDNQLFVAVEDKGQGIKSGDINEIFVPFTTISKKGTGAKKVTGLGIGDREKDCEKRIREKSGHKVKKEKGPPL